MGTMRLIVAVGLAVLLGACSDATVAPTTTQSSVPDPIPATESTMIEPIFNQLTNVWSSSKLYRASQQPTGWTATCIP